MSGVRLIVGVLVKIYKNVTVVIDGPRSIVGPMDDDICYGQIRPLTKSIWKGIWVV